MARVLMPLPDRDFDPTETAVPWRMLTHEGHEVVFATEAGGVAPAGDPLLLGGTLGNARPRRRAARLLRRDGPGARVQRGRCRGAPSTPTNSTA